MLITIYIYVKNTEIKNFILPLKYYLNKVFNMIFIEKSKGKNLSFWKVKEGIAFMSLNKFYNFFNYVYDDGF